MSNYSIFFSPTGGTLKVAEAFISGWGEEFKKVDIFKKDYKTFFNSGDLCLVSVPSYGGRVPAPAVERIKELKGNGARAIMCAAFGNRAIDDTLLELSDALKEAGFYPVAAFEAVAEHSLIPKYGKGRPDEDDVKELKAFAEKIKTDLNEDKLSNDVKVPGNRPYKEYNGVPLKPSVSGGCIGCGVCADECPVGAIPMMNFKMTDTKKCISCMHCVKVCPKHVRKLSKLMTFAASKKMQKVCSDRKENKLYI